MILAVARTLEIPVHGARDPVTQVGRAIGNRGRCLLVLDNVEQIARDAALVVARWREQAPQARFLVTTREALRIDGEQTFEVPALPPADAAELFLERVRISTPGFLLTPALSKSVEEIARRLEGIPLAIELAATRVAVLGLEGIQSRLSKRLDVLTRGAVGAASRQATLRGAIEWSWDLLTPAERDALAATSVFEGGFSLDAAEAVLGPRAIELLESLRDKSLLRSFQDPEFPDRMRFSSLESVRELAAEKLVASRNARAVVARHRDFFRARASSWTPRDLFAERLNLRAVVETCLGDGDAEGALDVALALDRVLATRGSARQRLDLADRVIGASAHAPVAKVARALIAGASAQRTLGHAERAEEYLERARKMAKSRPVEAEALVELGIVHHERRDLARATRCYEDALASSPDGPTRVRALGNLGAAAHDALALDVARAKYHEALALLVKHRDERLEGSFRFNLAILEQEAGNVVEAAEQYRRALDRLRAAPDQRLEAIAISSQGTLLQEAGDWQGALEAHDAALRMLRNVGDVRSEGLALARIGGALAMLERVAEARDSLDEAERLLESIDDAVSVAAAAANRALVELALVRESTRRGEAAKADAHRAALEKRLRDARAFIALSDDVRVVLRIADTALEAWNVPIDGTRLRIGSRGTWFEAPSRKRKDLAKHAAARRILLALVQRRESAPGRGIRLEELQEAGWPDETLVPEAAANRTHVALALLRKAGLKPWLLRAEDGYLLDPKLPVEWATRTEESRKD